MSKKRILTVIESVLNRYSKQQINLASGKAREEVAREILVALSSKYHIVEYESQETFE